jgi:hypothetical protein
LLFITLGLRSISTNLLKFSVFLLGITAGPRFLEFLFLMKSSYFARSKLTTVEKSSGLKDSCYLMT